MSGRDPRSVERDATFSCPKCGAFGVTVFLTACVSLNRKGLDYGSFIPGLGSPLYKHDRARCINFDMDTRHCPFEGSVLDFVEPHPTLAEDLAEEK